MSESAPTATETESFDKTLLRSCLSDKQFGVVVGSRLISPWRHIPKICTFRLSARIGAKLGALLACPGYIWSHRKLNIYIVFALAYTNSRQAMAGWVPLIIFFAATFAYFIVAVTTSQLLALWAAKQAISTKWTDLSKAPNQLPQCNELTSRKLSPYSRKIHVMWVIVGGGIVASCRRKS